MENLFRKDSKQSERSSGIEGCRLHYLEKKPPYASHFGGIWERQIRSSRAILACLLECHDEGLDTESLQILMAKCEVIVNSHLFTVQTINDVNSPAPLVPVSILTMNSKVIFSPPGSFSRPDLLCKKRWRRVQHMKKEFR